MLATKTLRCCGDTKCSFIGYIKILKHHLYSHTNLYFVDAGVYGEPCRTMSPAICARSGDRSENQMALIFWVPFVSRQKVHEEIIFIIE